MNNLGKIKPRSVLSKTRQSSNTKFYNSITLTSKKVQQITFQESKSYYSTSSRNNNNSTRNIDTTKSTSSFLTSQNCRTESTFRNNLNLWTNFSRKNFSTSTSKRFQWFKDDFMGQVTLVSYNVLSQIHLENHKYLYKGVDAKYLEWEYRERLLKEKLHNFIRGDNTNILCLQEVDQNKVETFYRPFLKSYGFNLIYMQRPDIDVTKSHSLKQEILSFPDGVAIAYDASKFMKGSGDFVNFNHKSSEVTGSGPAFKYSGHTSETDLNLSHIGLLQKFTCVRSMREFIIGTTHLAFNPFWGDVKLAQLMIYLHNLQSFSLDKSSGRTIPAILTGDLNTHATSPIFSDFIIDGYFNCSEKNCEELSSQLPSYYLKNLQKLNKSGSKSRQLAVPPIPQSLNIDYRTLTSLSKYKSNKDRDAEFFQARKKVQEESGNNFGPAFDFGLKAAKMTLTKGNFHSLRKEALNEVQNLEEDIYHGSLVPYIGHQLNLKMPYVKIHETSSTKSKPFTTILSDGKSKNVNNTLGSTAILVDHVIMSEQVPVYNYLTLPMATTGENVRGEIPLTTLGRDNPSDHMPIGINFGLD